MTDPNYISPRRLPDEISALLEDWHPQYLTPSEIVLLVGRTKATHVHRALEQLSNQNRIEIHPPKNAPNVRSRSRIYHRKAVPQ